MADNSISKLAQQSVDLFGAYDERTRLFNRLRDLRMNDETRAEVLKEYAAAAANFDKLRAAALKQ